MSLAAILGGIGAIAGLFKKDKTGKAIERATAAQVAAQEKGMKVYEQMTKEARRTNLASSLATSQSQYDLTRQVNAQNQAATLPYQMARLSALQSLPQMQQLLGIDAYALPTQVTQSQLPEMDMTAAYEATQNRLGMDQNAYRNAAIAAGADPSQLSNLGMPYGAVNAGTPGVDSTTGQPLTTTTSLKKLQPTQNLEYAIQSSPLYKWQLGEATRGLNNQLASSGLSGSTYAQRELGRRAESLAAQERERQISNLQWLTNLGMGGQAQVGNMSTPSIGVLGGDQSQMMSDMATAMGQGYAGIGAAQAQGGLALANYNANKPDPFGQLLGAAWMFGDNSNANRSTPAASITNPYSTFANQYATGLMSTGRVY